MIRRRRPARRLKEQYAIRLLALVAVILASACGEEPHDRKYLVTRGVGDPVHVTAVSWTINANGCVQFWRIGTVDGPMPSAFVCGGVSSITEEGR